MTYEKILDIFSAVLRECVYKFNDQHNIVIIIIINNCGEKIK